MHLVVCVKQVPDTAQVRIDPHTNTLIREGMPAIVNPYDLEALECALVVKDHLDARVTLLSMGPPAAAQALRRCLSYGADRAVLLTDRAFAGADTLATSYALAAGIRRLTAEDPVHLVLCGKQTIDGDTAQTGPGIARHLGWQQITSARQIIDINRDTGTLIVERRLERGRETIRTALPAVMSLAGGTEPIRYAALPTLIRGLRITPEVWTVRELDVETERLGLRGSPTRVKRTFTPAPRTGGERVVVAEVGAPAAAAAAADVLRHEGLMQEESWRN